jgi:hypothetical protein
MPHRIYDFLGGIPFLLITEGKIKMNYTRIIEALVIALFSAIVTTYLATNELKIKFAYLEGQNNRVEMQLIKTCERLESINTKVSAIDALQQERIERERLEKLRR